MSTLSSGQRVEEKSPTSQDRKWMGVPAHSGANSSPLMGLITVSVKISSLVYLHKLQIEFRESDDYLRLGT